MVDTKTADPSNRFVKQRTLNRMRGICALMVEYNVTLRELEEFFLNHYETDDAVVARKRKRQNQGPIRRERSQKALRTRWDKYDALRESNVVAREAALERVKAIRQPNFGIEDAKTPDPGEAVDTTTLTDEQNLQPIAAPESQVRDERLTKDLDADLVPEPKRRKKVL